MIDLITAKVLTALKNLQDVNPFDREKMLRELKNEADKTLMRLSDIMMVMEHHGAEVWMNYTELPDGKSGEISVGFKSTPGVKLSLVPKVEAPAFELPIVVPPGAMN